MLGKKIFENKIVNLQMLIKFLLYVGQIQRFNEREKNKKYNKAPHLKEAYNIVRRGGKEHCDMDGQLRSLRADGICIKSLADLMNLNKGKRNVFLSQMTIKM